MKSVLISIQPKWCELIASGKKTIEVRKTRPKIDTPFKVYIYQTKESKRRFLDHRFNSSMCGKSHHTEMGKVIGEFVCNGITIFEERNGAYYIPDFILKKTCLTDKELLQYGQGKELNFCGISDLIIYDNPKELSEFFQHDNTYDNAFGYAFEDRRKSIPLTRPPQSWCYVEEVE